jgi:hypothetical protein
MRVSYDAGAGTDFFGRVKFDLGSVQNWLSYTNFTIWYYAPPGNSRENLLLRFENNSGGEVGSVAITGATRNVGWNRWDVDISGFGDRYLMKAILLGVQAADTNGGFGTGTLYIDQVTFCDEYENPVPPEVEIVNFRFSPTGIVVRSTGTVSGVNVEFCTNLFSVPQVWVPITNNFTNQLNNGTNVTTIDPVVLTTNARSLFFRLMP